MGGHGSGRKPFKAFIPQRNEIISVGDGVPLEIPNLSGDHSAGTVLSTPVNGTDIANKKYVDDSVVSDHGLLTGLADDDHTQYILVDGTRAFTGVITQTIGTRNVIIGDSTAGNSGVTDDSIIIGDGAGAVMESDGINNVLIGSNAGAALTTSDGNVMIGFEAGETATTALGSTFIGNKAGKVCTGTRNTFVGNQSGVANTIGKDNTCIGYQAGNAIVDSDNNVLIGRSAGAGVVDKDLNTFIGANAGKFATGIGNTIVGANSGNAAGNTTANGTFFGLQSGNKHTTGGSNIYFGYNAGFNNTTGASNTFVGSQAGFKNVTNKWNTYIGEKCGNTNLGDGNVFIGRDVLRFSGATATNSVIIGYSAGNSTDHTGNNNVIIGQAAADKNTSGASNIYIGYNCARRQTTSSNQLIIDNQTRADAATELTNAIVYGVMAATPADQRLTFNAPIDVNGGFSGALIAKTGAYTATASDYTIICGAGNESFTVTPPTVILITKSPLPEKEYKALPLGEAKATSVWNATSSLIVSPK